MSKRRGPSPSLTVTWELSALADPRAPKHWMNNNVFYPVVLRYLQEKNISPDDVNVMRSYLTQWIDSPIWKGDGLEVLRLSVRQIRSRRDVDRWVADATKRGAKPL